MAFRLAVRMVDDEDEAQDVCQDAFIRAWLHFASFDPSRSFTTWIYRIVSNICLDRLRARRRWYQRFSRSVDQAHAAVDDAADPGLRMEQIDLVIHLERSIRSLPPTQRLVFALRDLEDLEVSEVVEATGLTEASVKTNLSYARGRLRKQLQHLDLKGTSL